MALFCFWSRRASSRYAVLGQPLPSGTRLEEHIARCPECREYWNDLRMLTYDLNRLVQAPHPSPQYAEPIWERVKPTSRVPQWGRLSLAATAACGLACGLVWWRFAHPERHPFYEPGIAAITKPPAEDPVPPLAPANAGPKRTQGAVPTLARLPASTVRHRLRWSPVRSAERLARGGHRSRHGGPVTIPLHGDESPESIRAAGLRYESEGDPGLANVAYQAAYQQHPTEETAFDMGRSAEESGDMEQAMNVYAGLLESADTRARAEKDWTP